jgi:hypothetical protein
MDKLRKNKLVIYMYIKVVTTFYGEFSIGFYIKS